MSSRTNNKVVRVADNLPPASSILVPNQPPLPAAATLSSVLTVAPATVEATNMYPSFTQQAPLQPTIPAAVQLAITRAHALLNPTAVGSIYPTATQPLIPTLLPPLIPTIGGIMQPSAHHQSVTMQPPVHQMISDTLPPVPAQIRQKIIRTRQVH